MRVMALFSTSFFAKYVRVVEDGPGQGHLCHTDTFLVSRETILVVLVINVLYVLHKFCQLLCVSVSNMQKQNLGILRRKKSNF